MKNNYSYKYEDKGIYCYKGSNVLINKLYIKNEGSYESVNGDNTKLHTIIERIIYTLSEEEHKKFLDTIKL